MVLLSTTPGVKRWWSPISCLLMTHSFSVIQNSTQLHYLRCLLICFEVVSGLRINLSKSEIVPKLEKDWMLTHWQVILDAMSHPLLWNIWVCLWGAHYKARHVWDSIIERMHKRLTSCKKLYLLKGGRLTLIKSTLSSIPNYFLSLSSLPTSVTSWKKIQRDFLYGGVGEESKFHLVNWNVCCTPICRGG